MRFLLTILAGLMVSGAAYAGEMSAMDPHPVETPYTWDGLYFGVEAGGGWGNFRDDYTTLPNTVEGSLSGGLLGGLMGFNWQPAELVWGLETDLAWAGLGGSKPSPLPYYDVANVRWFGTTRLRVGMPKNNVLWFVSGGVAYGDVHRDDTGPNSPSVVSQHNTNVGWTIGVGADMSLHDGWGLRGEYLYVDLGSSSFPASAGGFSAYDREVNFSVLRAAITKKF